ncbi:unnamed protein product [Adineta ricciae]|uniref:Uncharacterized protein n=1 Tax=Adineta ricciae TaxID=249248 RepID=A0A815TTH2_ADIRI|nr:unnamed protein product [Adineta ricciae]
MPYQKKEWCSHPSHISLTRSGSKPSHPVGRRTIDERDAKLLNTHIILNSEWASVTMQAGDKVCQTCFNTLSDLMKTCLDTEQVLVETPEAHNSELRTINTQLKKDSAKEEVNRVFQALKMETIRDDRRIKQIRNQIDDVYRHLQNLCDVLEDNDPQLHLPNPHSLEINESNDLLNGLKELYKQSSEEEQTRLMTIAPLSWGRVMLSKWFGCTDHHGRQALLLREEKNVLAFPEYSRGNKFLDQVIIDLIVEFYLQDGISRMSSNTKDVIKIKTELVTLRFMEMTVSEALRKFYEDYPMIKVGKSSFFSLRPRQVKLHCPHDTCMCHVHENMSLALQAYNKYVQRKSSGYPRLEKITLSNLIDSVVCDQPNDNCFLNCCSRCNRRLPSSILQQHFIIVDEDDEWTWSIWKTTNKKVDLHHIHGSIMSLLGEIDGQWKKFLTHSYFNREQRSYINNLRLLSSDTSYATVQIDFAENYTIIRQREVQAAHWNNVQVTIFTVHIKVGTTHKNMAIVSDYMRHDTAFVYCAQRIIVDFLKKHYPQITKISYISDGAPSHFKNHSNMINLIHHRSDFNIEASWSFSASGHGKGPSDGIGATLKSGTNRSILSSGTILSSAEDFFNFTKKINDEAALLKNSNGPPINVYYLNSITIENVNETLLSDRFKQLNGRIEDIRQVHQFDPKDEFTIFCRKTSYSLIVEEFTLRTNTTDEQNKSLQQIKTIEDISIDYIVIVNDDEKHYLAKVIDVRESAEEQSEDKCNYPVQKYYCIFYLSASICKENYRFPKPLCKIVGRPILFWLLDHLDTNVDDIIYIGVMETLQNQFDLTQSLKIEYPQRIFQVVVIDFETRGALETLFIMLQSINTERLLRKTISFDCDTVYLQPVIEKFRRLSDHLNASFFFEDNDGKPIYSYLKLNENNRQDGFPIVENTCEKIMISNCANTGAYAFRSASTLKRYCAQLLDETSGQYGKYYTTHIIKTMLDNQEPFVGIQIAVTDFVCLGTPDQLNQFLRHLKGDKPAVNIRKMRFCFDLDNTLVSYPKEHGNYISVEPKIENIKLAHELHTAGHYIIIQTARQMKIHNNNVGAAVADIGRITLETLSRFNIPYDELLFGKAYADVYVDDCAIHALIDTLKEIGWSLDNAIHNHKDQKQIRGFISSRHFHTVQNCKNKKDYYQLLIPNSEKIATALDPNYEGDLDDGKKCGQGVYTWPDGRRYKGQWQDDKQHGEGVFTWLNGDEYSGEWKDDKRHGKGTFTWSDGRRYEGDWVNNVKSGEGIEVTTDDDRYEGEWKNDKKHGKGVYIWSDGRRFEGQWKDDKQGSDGVYIYPDGSRYEGEMKNGMKDGKGIEIDEDGDRYEGQWKNDQKHGYGTLTMSNGYKYEGNWENDEMNGKGTEIDEDGDRYEGDWDDGSKHGKGTETKKNGDRYEGDWDDNSKHGKGTEIKKNGDRYEGDWDDNERNGEGTETLADGQKYSGRWKKNRKHGKGVQYYSNNLKFEGEWKTGERNAEGRLTLPTGMIYTGHISDEFIEQAKNNRAQCGRVQWTYYSS